MEEAAKGSVTPLSSLFTSEEAEKAAKRVEEKIEEKQNEINRLKEFVAENSDLINLVKRLPDQLHHDIMVPFGEAAFFPGRLIHTNEFLVLLGENYYVERTSKQTAEILKRRGKILELQTDSLKANIRDLKAEASFFGATASEAAQGLVEIREDYVEESPAGKGPQSGVGGEESIPEVDDDEYQHVMARLEELEREELVAESEGNRNENQQSNAYDDGYQRMMARLEELEMEELAAGSEGNRNGNQQPNAYDNDVVVRSADESKSDTDEDEEPKVILKKESHSWKPSQQKGDTVAQVLPNQLDPYDQFNCTGLAVQRFLKDETSCSSSSQQKVRIPLNLVDKASNLPVGMAISKAPLSQRNQPPVERSRPGFDSSRAFTGSIVEHAPNLQPNLREQKASSSQATDSQPSKRVSRFKMQRS